MKKFPGNQVLTLTKSSFDKTKNYFLTEKFDGKRYLLVVINDRIIRFSQKMESEIVDINKKFLKISGTILDTEYYNGVYHVFDILHYKDSDCTEDKLVDRIKKYTNIVKYIKEPRIKSKNYIKPKGNTLCLEMKKLLKKIKSRFIEGDLDGIILTSTGPYDDKIYKYKPKELLSIDFKIKKKNGDTFLLLLQNGKVFSPKIKKYKNVGIVKVSEKNYNLYENNSIVEFIFKNGQFVPLRSRPDKIKSNSTFVIIDNFKEIISNDTLDDIIC